LPWLFTFTNVERSDSTFEFAAKRSQIGLHYSQIGLHRSQFGHDILDPNFEVTQPSRNAA
jgi:hypothetical protein